MAEPEYTKEHLVTRLASIREEQERAHIRLRTEERFLELLDAEEDRVLNWLDKSRK